MIGIVSYGAYIPIYRMSHELLNDVWEISLGAGERAVTYWDEDSITMAVEAVLDCIRGFEPESIGGLYFASTTAPYLEKQSASIIASACNLPKTMFTGDFAHSLRGGTSALRAAADAINAGSSKRVAVVASDCRLAPPNSEFEPLFGDGAAALLLGDSDVIAMLEGGYTTTSDFIDVWRREEDTYLRTWEDRFVISEGCVRHTEEAVSELMRRYSLAPGDFNKVVLYAPNPRTHNELARKLGFDVRNQVQEPMFNLVGNTGAAFTMMMLVAALEEAKPDDRILFVSYGDGVDAYIFRVTDQIEKCRDRRGIKRHLNSKKMLSSYGKYIQFRKLMEWEAGPRVPDPSSLTVLMRERDQLLRFMGAKCRQCGTIQFPIQRICTWCQAKDDFDQICLRDSKGTLFTFSMNERANVVDLPDVIAIVDFEEGGRFWGKLTDRDPKRIEVGMPVELTFRKMHEGEGLCNYFWKARPVRC